MSFNEGFDNSFMVFINDKVPKAVQTPASVLIIDVFDKINVQGILIPIQYSLSLLHEIDLQNFLLSST